MCTARQFLAWNRSVLFGAGFWYHMNPVPDLHDTCTRNRSRKHGVDFQRRFLERVSWVVVGMAMLFTGACP